MRCGRGVVAVVVVACGGFALGIHSSEWPGLIGRPALVANGPAAVRYGGGDGGRRGGSVRRGPVARRGGAGVSGPGGAVAGSGGTAAGGRVSGPAVAAVTTAAQADPERLDPTLGRRHRRLLAERPVLQHLPYRDRVIGVDFDRVLGDGRLELLVTYLGRRAGAVGDLRRLLARYGDPGVAYVERYERVF